MSYTTIITSKGKELLTKAITGAPLPLSRMVLSSIVGNGTTLGNEAMSVSINAIEKDGTKIKVSANYINDGVSVGFHIHEIGIFANDPRDGDVLFSISKSSTPDYMPGRTEHALEEQIHLYLEVGSANIVTRIDSKIFATREEVAESSSSLQAWATSMFALRAHNHDLIYAPYVHNHNGVYAPVAHNHDTAYLGKTAKAADANLLDGRDSSYFATAGHNHSGLYEPVIGAKRSGFNLNKSDSVSSTSSSYLATTKAVKVAYDKGVSAYNLAAGKLGATATAVNSDKYQNRNDIFHPGNYGTTTVTSASTTVTSAYTNRVVHVNSASNTVHTLLANTHPAGSQIPFTRLGTGEVTFAAGSGLSIRQSERQIKEKNDMVVAVFITTNDVLLVGPRK